MSILPAFARDIMRLITIPALRVADPHRNGDNTCMRRTRGSSPVTDILRPDDFSVFPRQMETDVEIPAATTAIIHVIFLGD